MAVAAAERSTSAGLRPRRASGTAAGPAPVATVPMGLLAERRALLVRLLGDDPEAPPALRARAWTTLANLASDVGDGTAGGRGDRGARRCERGRRRPLAGVGPVLPRPRPSGRRVVTDGLGAAIDEATPVSPPSVRPRRRLDALDRSQVRVDPDARSDARRAGGHCDVPAARHPLRPGPRARGPRLVALGAGDRATARTDLGEALTIVSDAGNTGCTAHCVESVAAFAAAGGRLAVARRLLDVAAVLRDVGGHGCASGRRSPPRRRARSSARRCRAPLPPGLDIALAAELARDVLGDRHD